MESMLPYVIVVAVLVVLPLAYVAVAYNRFVQTGNYVTESWRNVDTELQRRYNLIPNLVELVRGYAKHEREVFERVIEARNRAVNSRGNPASQAADENVLVGALKGLFAVVEGYPDLKASRNFLQLQQELVNTEDRIQAARRFYNGNVRTFNNLVQSFPTNLVASVFSFPLKDYFEVDSADVRRPVEVHLH